MWRFSSNNTFIFNSKLKAGHNYHLFKNQNHCIIVFIYLCSDIGAYFNYSTTNLVCMTIWGFVLSMQSTSNTAVDYVSNVVWLLLIIYGPTSLHRVR